jgi:hypothetical protein
MERPTVFKTRKIFTVFLEQVLKMLRARIKKNQAVFRAHISINRNSRNNSNNSF